MSPLRTPPQPASPLASSALRVEVRSESISRCISNWASSGRLATRSPIASMVANT